MRPRAVEGAVKLRDVMQADVPTATPDESATVAWERMSALGADYLVVTKDREILGVLCRHDLAGPDGGNHRRMGRRVGDLMQRDVRTAAPGTSVATAAASMQGQKLGCLPIVERHKLVGMVTTSDMLGIVARGPVSARSSHR
jgi:acetoin utilization protein AcuB